AFFCATRKRAGCRRRLPAQDRCYIRCLALVGGMVATPGMVVFPRLVVFLVLVLRGVLALFVMLLLLYPLLLVVVLWSQLLLMLDVRGGDVAAAGVAVVVARIATFVTGVGRTVVCISATAAVVAAVEIWPCRWRTVGRLTIPLVRSTAVARRLTRLVAW